MGFHMKTTLKIDDAVMAELKLPAVKATLRFKQATWSMWDGIPPGPVQRAKRTVAVRSRLGSTVAVLTPKRTR